MKNLFFILVCVCFAIFFSCTKKENKIYAINLLPSPANDYCYLEAVNKKNDDKQCLFDVSNRPETTFFTGGSYLTRGKNINFGGKFDNNIYGIEHDTVNLKYAFDFGKYNLPEKYKQKNIEKDELSKVLESNEYVYSLLEISENDNYLFFNTNLPGLYVYSKKDNLLKKYSFVLDGKYGFNYSRMIAIENSANNIAFFISASFFDNLKKYILEGNQSVINPDLLSQIESVNSEDNPILMICELK
jgi:hypothetical protein